ncbi:MAG: tetratricopeptide repeat protein [Chloroflexi bacterium]|nr:tetratricopeptide repeat protein [Chloroflexota bacterium]
MAVQREEKDLDARELNELGNAYVDYGMWERAEECYRRSLELRRASGDQRGEGLTLHNLGALYQRLGRWEEACEQYRLSLALAQESGEAQSELASAMNLCLIHYSLSETEEFLKLAQETEALARSLEAWEPLARLSWLRGRIAFATGQEGAQRGMEQYAQALHFASRKSPSVLRQMAGYLGEEIQSLVERGEAGTALVLCDYLLALSRREGLAQEAIDLLEARRREVLYGARLGPPAR